MNPVMTALRAGWSRGLIELRQSFTNAQDLFGQLFWPVVLLVTLFFMRGAQVPTGGMVLGAMVLPSLLGMNIIFYGMLAIAQLLTVEREDGTLLRAKAIPNGMLGYLFGKLVTVSGGLIINVVILLIAGSFFVDGLAVPGVGSWLMLAGVLVLGMVATLPLGAVFGALITNPRSLGLLMLPMMGLVAISGIFYPITALAPWLQWLAQVFPIYWLALGMRSAMLPDGAAAAEIGQSWRHLETIGVLGAWAIVGLILAPIVLRRMARRESGSSVAERREKAMQRVG
ncbi:ABC-2 type transport system permease protein [Amycolatopsis xylanica]|uniref:ABC-2 type transport system permease protein n=1 Tax=Amycolatopsis xylanica TaxID=589385 RepID=A0A1H3HRL3_9PSEU|nr:ABC transporter permease [Amycolatopsis xylanica]SDY17438.1 ABC-2 type transport system permease protein [Amycolatopsis xylanica]